MGRKLIPSWLLEDVVNALVREPRARQSQLRRGQDLLRAAEKTALEKTALEEEKPASGSQTQLEIRLDEARKGQLQAQETLLSTTQIIYTLLAVVASLRERCAVLEKERDRVAERIPATAAEVRQQLAESERRLADTETRLERARREREEAEELRIEAQLIAQKHRRALEQFQQRSRRRSAEEDSDGQVPGESSSSAVNELPELWEYDQVLAAADQQLDAHDAQITALRRHMGLTPSRSDEEPDRVVVGEVVRDQAADNPDSTAASTDVDHPVSADNAPRPDGPWDASEVKEPGEGRVDLGGLFVPSVEGMELRVEVAGDAIVAATAVLQDSAVQLQAFAAPSNEGIWDEVREEIAAGITQQGGVIDEVEGPLGWELRAQVPVQLPDGTNGVQVVRFVGIDGPRWFLRGVISGQGAVQPQAAGVLEHIFRDTVVIRGEAPMAPRDPIVLRV